MHKLPLEFSCEANASGDFEKLWTTLADDRVLYNAIPVEFGGSGGGYSPEHLFLQSVMNCFIGTFKVIAKSSKLNFSKLSVDGHLTVDKGADGKTCMKAIALKIKIYDSDRPDRLDTLVGKVFRDGFIINSVKSEIKYDLEILQSKSELQV